MESNTIATTTPATTADQIAEIIGEDRRRVTEETVDWSVFTRGGVLVSLTIGICDYATKMSAADWGINMSPDDEEAVALRAAMERTHNFGYRYLIPRDWVREVQKIQSDGREALLDASFRISDQTRNVRYFIPLKRYASWRATNDALREQFEIRRAELSDRWEEFQTRMDADYRTVIRGQYKSLAAQGVKLPGTADEYAETAIERSRKRVQTREQAVEAFRWNWEVKTVTFANVPDLRGMSPELRQDLKRSGALEANSELQAFVADLQGEVRGRVFDVVVGMLTTMRKREGKLTETNIRQLRDLTAWIGEMQFWPDVELDARLKELRAAIGDAPAARDGQQLQAVLTELGVEMRSYLLDINRPVKRSGVEVGIPDDRRGLAAARRRKRQTVDIAAAPAVDVTAPTPRARKARPIEMAAVVTVASEPVVTLAEADQPGLPTTTIEDVTSALVAAATV